MSESFKFFSKKSAVTNRNAIVLIPSAIADGTNDPRESNTAAQVHSVYIAMESTARVRGVNRYNPAKFVGFDLCVESASDSSMKCYIVHDGRIVPGAPFFIEKNITLEPEHKLVLYTPEGCYEYNASDISTDVQLNTDSNVYIHASASAVLFPTSN